MVTLTYATWNTAGGFLPIANTVSNANGGPNVPIAILELIVVTSIAVAAGPMSLSRRKHLAPEASQ